MQESIEEKLDESLISWQDAVSFMLAGFTNYSHIQKNLETMQYTVTSIQTAWDYTEQNEGKFGWMISVCAKSPLETSPTGWQNRHFTGVVSGGIQ